MAAASTAWTTVRSEPITVAIMVVCCGVWFWMWNRRIPPDQVAISYRAVVLERHYYRIVTAAFVHLSWMHIIFNMTTLFTFGMEPVMGPVEYVRVTLLLLFLCKAAWLGLMHYLIHRGGRPHYVDSSGAGYSGVLFGWMALQSLANPSQPQTLLGLITLPSLLVPWVSLFLTKLIVPQSSFLGHLAGIVAGYAIATHALDWLTGYWFWTGCLYLAAALLLSLKANANTPWLNRYVTVSPAFVSGTGMGAAITEVDAATAATRDAQRYMANGVLRVVRHVDGVEDGTSTATATNNVATGLWASLVQQAQGAWHLVRHGGSTRSVEHDRPAAAATPQTARQAHGNTATATDTRAGGGIVDVEVGPGGTSHGRRVAAGSGGTPAPAATNPSPPPPSDPGRPAFHIDSDGEGDEGDHTSLLIRSNSGSRRG